jgi:hypothetical protein
VTQEAERAATDPITATFMPSSDAVELCGRAQVLKDDQGDLS